MKYFATQTKPAKFEDGIFKFRKKIIFEVTESKAHDLYIESGVDKYVTLDTVEDCWLDGTHITTGTMGSLSLWGEDISDEELFKRRLAGTLAPDILR